MATDLTFYPAAEERLREIEARGARVSRDPKVGVGIRILPRSRNGHRAVVLLLRHIADQLFAAECIDWDAVRKARDGDLTNQLTFTIVLNREDDDEACNVSGS